MLCVRPHPYCRFYCLRRGKVIYRPHEIRIQSEGTRYPRGQTEDDWNPGKDALVRFNHELQWGWSNRDDYIRPAISVLSDIKFAKSLLIC